MSRYDGQTWKNFTTKDGLAHNIVSSVLRDREGNFWFSTSGGGVSRYDGEAFTTFTTKDGLAHNIVRSIFLDREGHLWVGTVAGISRHSRSAFTTFTTEDGLANDAVESMVQDSEGRFWFGTHGGGVSRYDGKSWTTFTTEDGLANDVVQSMVQDSEGRFWFGTHGGGVSRYDGKSWTTFTREDGLTHNTVWSIFQDQDGTLWFGTGDRDDPNSGGLSRYDGESFSAFTKKDGLSDNIVLSISQDREKTLWFGTENGGVIRCIPSKTDGYTLTAFTQKDGLASNTIWSIMQDQNGHLWFGSVEGISRYDGRTFTTFTQKDGLAHDWAGKMLQDRKGDFWFTTEGGGVSRYNGQIFQPMFQQDGLASNAVYSVLQDGEEDFWFGTAKGVTRFRPPAPSSPPVFIHAVAADRRYEEVSELAIPSSVGLVAFEFHGISFKTRPGGLVYRYRLVGYDADWKNTRTRRVEYQNLPTGSYTFEVQAVDRDLVYSERPATVSLEVYYQPMSSSVRMSDINLQNVFASFYKTYAEKSIGSVFVTNDDPNPVEATVSLFIPGLMGRPTAQTLSMEPSSDRLVPLRAVLNPDVLTLEGDTPVQAEVALSCEVGEETISVKRSPSITVHGRGALTWDDLGRAAAFVTPEDKSVSTFARGLYEAFRHQIKGKKVDGNIPTAMLIFEALSTYGIKYAQDSSTPYSQVRADKSAVDHIQYPAELLGSRMGDCDDCTVLYCALLENLNIPTAFVDAPDHLLMMFDSGVTADRERGFSLSEGRYVKRGDRLWVPVEVTALGESSFMRAWELGASICARLASEGAIPVTNVREVWAEYPYAVPPIEIDVQPPVGDALERAFVSDVSALQEMRRDYERRQYIGPLMDNPEDHTRRMAYARSKIEAEAFNDAIGILMPLLNTGVKAEAYYLVGCCYAGEKDHESAIRYFEKALEHDPENDDYAHGLQVLRDIVSRK